MFGAVRVETAPPDFDLGPTDLVPGAEAGSAAILEAETRIAAAWRERGHPLVAIGERNIVAAREYGMTAQLFTGHFPDLAIE